MADVRVFPNHFRTKEQAIAEIMKDGYWPVSWIDKPGGSYEPHRHRDDETLYLVESNAKWGRWYFCYVSSRRSMKPTTRPFPRCGFGVVSYQK